MDRPKNDIVLNYAPFYGWFSLLCRLIPVSYILSASTEVRILLFKYHSCVINLTPVSEISLLCHHPQINSLHAIRRFWRSPDEKTCFKICYSIYIQRKIRKMSLLHGYKPIFRCILIPVSQPPTQENLLHVNGYVWRRILSDTSSGVSSPQLHYKKTMKND